VLSGPEQEQPLSNTTTTGFERKTNSDNGGISRKERDPLQLGDAHEIAGQIVAPPTPLVTTRHRLGRSRVPRTLRATTCAMDGMTTGTRPLEIVVRTND
jgi:hypothetical protein